MDQSDARCAGIFARWTNRRAPLRRRRCRSPSASVPGASWRTPASPAATVRTECVKQGSIRSPN
eukprot:6740099-Pyramimonas_sp.AAC.1